MTFHIIIPARFASERLPGKILLEIAGKPMIQWVYERAKLCEAESITIATDDERIEKAAKAFGAKTCMTNTNHSNGTSRLAEAVEILKLPADAVVVNIQGDEPLFPIEAIQKVVKGLFEHPQASMSTLCTPIRNPEEITNPNCVKVVFDKYGFALYFSRAPIPFDRDFESKLRSFIESKSEFSNAQPIYYRHLGLYAYRANTLLKYRSWERAPMECIESLEQLRMLWHGEKIHVSCVEESLPPGIDTEADYQRVCRLMEKERVVI